MRKRIGSQLLTVPNRLGGEFGRGRKRANRKPVAVAGGLNWIVGSKPAEAVPGSDSLKGCLPFLASKFICKCLNNKERRAK